MTDVNVTVYSRPGCMPCRATIHTLKRLGMEHAVVDLSKDAAAAQRLKEEGWLSSPVVEVCRRGERAQLQHSAAAGAVDPSEGWVKVAAWSGLRLDALNALAHPGADLSAYDGLGL